MGPKASVLQDLKTLASSDEVPANSPEMLAEKFGNQYPVNYRLGV